MCCVTRCWPTAETSYEKLSDCLCNVYASARKYVCYHPPQPATYQYPPLPSQHQRLSSTFSHFFTLSHILMMSAIISTVNRNQQTEVCLVVSVLELSHVLSPHPSPTPTSRGFTSRRLRLTPTRLFPQSMSHCFPFSPNHVSRH